MAHFPNPLDPSLSNPCLRLLRIFSPATPLWSCRKSSRKADATADAVHATRCRTARSCTTAACSLSSSAAPPRPCGCCSTTTSPIANRAASSSFMPETDRWGDIWSVFVPGLEARPALSLPGRRPVRSRSEGQRFDPQARLIDPYARALAGDFLPGNDGIIRPPKCVVIDDTFDWQGDRHLRRGRCPKRSSTRCTSAASRAAPSSGVEHPGTYLGVIEKIPYLKSLGVTAVELMPVHEFPIEEPRRHEARAPELLGLRPDGLLLAAPRLLAGDEPGAQVREFKEMVRELHAAGIEVILDVVFNHTAEGNEHGPDVQLQGPGEPRLLHAERRRHVQELSRLRQHGQRQSPDRPRDDLPLPAALGAQLPRRWLPLRSGLDSRAATGTASSCRIRRWSS